jgi:acetolactate synthase-1/2/3 large subunit
MRVSDYIAKILSEKGVRHVYGLVGGGSAGLNDGFFCNQDIEFIGFHHEQGAGYAALAASKTNKKLSVVNVTTGCGGTNALTPCLSAWQDSVPMLFLSGNVNKFSTSRYINKENNIQLRKYGLQEHDIVSTVQNMTKFSHFIESVEEVPYILSKAIYIAESGRSGPVWIDIPANIQLAEIKEPYNLFIPESLNINIDYRINDIISELKSCVRPLVIAGQGVSLSNSNNLFKEFIEKINIPFVTTFGATDILSSNHKNFIGVIGIKGNRSANFAMQNSDLLIILGSSMNTSHIGYDTKIFSPKSKKIMIDIDINELKKEVISIDIPICGDIKDFLSLLLLSNLQFNFLEWNQKTSYWKLKWSTYDKKIHRSDKGGINLYEVVESFNRNLNSDSCVVVDAGQSYYVCPANLKIKENQKLIIQLAQGDMGFIVPGTVGIHKANPTINIIACVGDGSFFSNVQELAVIKQHKIPVKIFVINNDGYLSLRQTQDKFFKGRRHAVSSTTGMYFPSIEKIANAFEIKYQKINNNKELDYFVPLVLNEKEPIIIEIVSQLTLDVFPAQAIKPDGTQAGLHDMAPFLSESELKREMIISI